MPNHGYPDNDGSREPQGRHDEGWQRVTCYPAENMMTPPTVADMATNKDPLNVYSCSDGDESVPNRGWRVDGNSNASNHPYIPAAYPVPNTAAT